MKGNIPSRKLPLLILRHQTLESSEAVTGIGAPRHGPRRREESSIKMKKKCSSFVCYSQHQTCIVFAAIAPVSLGYVGMPRVPNAWPTNDCPSGNFLEKCVLIHSCILHLLYSIVLCCKDILISQQNVVEWNRIEYKYFIVRLFICGTMLIMTTLDMIFHMCMSVLRAN